MTRRMKLAAILTLALLPTAMFLTRASAHFPGVEATATCVDVRATVNVLVVSWLTDDDARRYNDRIEVYYDGELVGTGKFLPTNDFAFTVATTRLADGSTHTIKAVAANDFGANHEYGFAGTSRQTTVTLPTSCVPATTAPTTTAPTTTAPTTTTTTTRPTTTAPPTTAAPTTTVPTQVQGEVVTRLPDAQVAQPVVRQPSFTG